PIYNHQRLLANRPEATSEEFAALAANEADGDLYSARLALPEELASSTQDIGVERAAEASVAGDDEDFDVARRPLLQQWMGGPIHAEAEVGNDHAHLVPIRPGRQDAILRPLELGRGHPLPGLGDLLGALDGADLAPQVLHAWHR